MLKERGMTERTACKRLRTHRSGIRYQPRHEDPVNIAIRFELRRLSAKHRRYGTPRMTDRLKRDGYPINHKRIERIWREEKLLVPRKRRRRKKGMPMMQRPHPASKPNEVWSLDFMHDRTVLGQKLKLLTVVDEHTRECLEVRVEKRMKSADVIDTLDEILCERPAPKFLRSDNGPEFVSGQTQDWLKNQGIQPVNIEPGCPWENGFIESFNGKLRDECLNEEIFWSRAEAQVIVDWYRDVYNHERPHRSLGMKTPAEAASESGDHYAN